MDVWKALQELYAERARLDRVISSLESLESGVPPQAPARRGRKHMPPGERRVVSERMKRYWAAKRAPEKAPPAPESS